MSHSCVRLTRWGVHPDCWDEFNAGLFEIVQQQHETFMKIYEVMDAGRKAGRDDWGYQALRIMRGDN